MREAHSNSETSAAIGAPEGGADLALAALFDPARYLKTSLPAPPTSDRPKLDDAEAATVQNVLDLVPGSVALLEPVRDRAGEITDFRVLAASPDAVDIAGRRGRQMVGLSVADTYQTISGGPLWEAYLQVLANGRPAEVGPFTYTEVAEGIEAEAAYTVRARPYRDCVLINWTRHDEERRFAARVAQYERLGNLGWAEWDLTRDEVTWSDQLYEIFGRDRSAGPAALDDIGELIHPEDRASAGASTERLLRDGQPIDVTYRIRPPGGIRHVRAIFEPAVDATGRPLRVFGILQDVTTEAEVRRDRARLAEVEHALIERDRDLRTEHRLVTQLQQLILPLPSAPLRLPGLTAAVRFQPAEQLARVGGDWYDVVELPCGRTLLVIGDVAGHGIAAAATMMRLRHALAAFAVTTDDPARLLDLLNQMVCEDITEPTATAVVARYEPDTATLVWAQAGHPPPVLVNRSGARTLDRPRGILLGGRRQARYALATTMLGDDDTVLLYTDGLVERRGPYEAEWLRPVLDDLRRYAGAPLDSLVNNLRPANTADDMCLLALRPNR